MDYEILDHNKETLDQVLTFVYKNEDCCVVNPCGSGKTSIMAKFIEMHPDSTFVILTKQINAKKYYEQDQIFTQDNVRIVTFNKMNLDLKRGHANYFDVDYILVDEAHYIGAFTWNDAYTTIKQLYNPISIGFTATPQRYSDQGSDETVVSKYFNNNSCGNFTVSDLQRKNVFIEPEYVLSLYNFDKMISEKKNLAYDLGMENKYIPKLDMMLDEWNKESNPVKVISKYMPKYIKDGESNLILVYSPDTKVLKEHKKFIVDAIREAFPNKRVRSYVYTYHSSEDKFQTFLDRTTDIKILFSVDKATETLHIDNLRTVIMLRPSVSNRIITQQFGRVNNCYSKDRCLIIDMVGNLNNIQSEHFFANIQSIGVSQNKIYKSISISFAKRCSNVFSEIDKIPNRTKLYNVNGIKLSLSEIAQIYHKDLKDLSRLVNLEENIYEAIENAQTKMPKMTQKVFDDIYDMQINRPMNDKDREEFTKYSHVINDMILRYNITDDDLIQELNLYLCKIIVSDIYLNNITVRSNLTRYLFRRLDMKNRREKVFVPIHQHTNIWYDTLIDYVASFDTKSLVVDVLDTLTDRESMVMILRFYVNMYLDTVGDIYNVQRERIRQIEQKALRKLRHPSRSRKLKDMIESQYNLVPTIDYNEY